MDLKCSCLKHVQHQMKMVTIMNKNIIIAVLCVILVAAVGGFVLSHPQTTTEDGKINTQLNFLSGDKLTNGQTVEFELKDLSGNVIAGETVKISYVANGVTEKYAINTDAQGRGHLVLSGEDAGSYEITLNYNGSSKYNGCTAKQTLTIIEDSSSQNQNTVVQSDANSTANTVLYNNVTSSSGSSNGNTDSTQSQEDPTHQYVANLYYDEVLGVYYDDFGIIHGGDMDGNEIYILRELYEHPNTDEYGNPQWDY